MLRAKAQLKITERERRYRRSDEIRPMIEVGGSFLFSGRIKSPLTEYLYNQTYVVDIEFDTIEWVIYRCLKSMFAVGTSLPVREGNKVTGEAKLLECVIEK